MAFLETGLTPELAAELVKKHITFVAAAKVYGCGETTMRKHFNRAVEQGITADIDRRVRKTDWTPEKAVEMVKKYGSARKAAEVCGCGKTTVQSWYNKAVKVGLAPPINSGQMSREEIKEEIKKRENPSVGGRVEEFPVKELSVPKRGVKRYIFTSAQNNTKLFEPFWNNLVVLSQYYKANIHVSRYTYIKQGLGSRGDKAQLVKPSETDKNMWYDSRIADYLSDHRMKIAPGLVWCGESNTLPTAVNPLSGFETYTGRDSGIFPHSKISMQSIPSAKNEPTKFNYTTGTVTQRNYIHRKSGLKADFHHSYGALLVEVDSEGSWWCRQINANHEGTICDIDIMVKNGILTTGNRVEAITFGDIHQIRLDKTVERMAWYNKDSMVRVLKPKYQFLHDVLDFRGRNHHERNDPFKKLLRYVDGEENVRDEVYGTMNFIRSITDLFKKNIPDLETIVVDSNHDRALEIWLKESDWKADPVNMEFYLMSSLAKVRSILDRDRDFHMMKYWAEQVGVSKEGIRFLDEDESFILFQDHHGGIECGMHGHLGPNGSRGSINNLKRMGRKANIGHSHTAGIQDGIFQAGTSSELDLGYNVGPSSWSHSHIVTYCTGKRAIYTMWGSKWRA